MGRLTFRVEIVVPCIIHFKGAPFKISLGKIWQRKSSLINRNICGLLLPSTLQILRYASKLIASGSR